MLQHGLYCRMSPSSRLLSVWFVCMFTLKQLAYSEEMLGLSSFDLHQTLFPYD